jgi:membrane protease YdiL (CAAX protease family)
MGMYILASELFNFEHDSVTRVMEIQQLIILGINFIMFLLIMFFVLKKEGVKKIEFRIYYKKLFFSLFLVYLVRILISPILSPRGSESQANLLDNFSLVFLSLYFINYVIFPSINEELIFRGYILKKFINNKRDLIIGMILSSILFTSTHIGPEVNYSSIIYIFILGLAFGLIYIRFGLIVSIISHVFINFISYAEKYLTVDLIFVNYFENDIVYWLTFAIASIALIGLLYKGLSNFQI